MMNLWIFISYIFDVILLIMFSSIFLTKYSRKWYIHYLSLILIEGSILVYALHTNTIYYVIIGRILLFLCYVSILYKDNMYKKLVITILFYVVYMMYVLACHCIVSIFSLVLEVVFDVTISTVSVGFIIFIKILAYLCLVYIHKYHLLKYSRFLISKHILCTLVPGVLLLYLNFYRVYVNNDSLDMETSLLLLGFIGVLSYVLFIEKKLDTSIVELRQLETYVKTLEMQMMYYKDKLEQDTEIRRMKHDIKNNLITIEMLLQEEKYDHAQLYLNELTKVPALKKTIATGNDILDALLNIHIQKYPDIDFRFDIQGLQFQIEKYTLAVIVGNAMNNAIEALQKVKKDRICIVRMKEDQQMILMKFMNTYEIEPIVENGIFHTTKDDKKHHGIGIMSIKKEVEKHQGKVTIDINKKKKEFVLSILLMKQN